MLRMLLTCGRIIIFSSMLWGGGQAERPVVGYPVQVPVAMGCVVSLPPEPRRYVDMLAPDARSSVQLSAILADQVLLEARNKELRDMLLACQ